VHGPLSVNMTTRPPRPAAPVSPASEALLHLSLVGGNSRPRATGLDRLSGVSNYFIGADPRRWRTNVPAYARVAYHDVYPGVDAIYDSARGVLEYDLVVAPRASVCDVRLALDGGGTPMLTARGDLTVRMAGSLIEQRAPHVYQTIFLRPAEPSRDSRTTEKVCS